MEWLKTIAFSAVLIGLLICNADAGETIASGDFANTPTVVGLGIAVVPDYLGSDDYKAVPLPFVKYTFGGSERYIKLAGPELSFNLLDHPNIYLGPVARYDGSRDDSVNDDVVKRMKAIDSGISLGAFIAYEIKDANPRDRINFTFKWLSDISGNYSGYLMDFDVTVWRRADPKWDVFFGGGITYADKNYMDTYFGVNSTNRGDTTPSELPNFTAGGGIRDVRLQAGAIWYRDTNWLLGGLIRCQGLVGDASDSPVVDKRGSDTQMGLALFAGYRW